MARRKLSRPRLGLALALALVIPVLSACGTTSTSPSYGRQRAAGCQPAGHQCRAVGIECRRRWHVHRRMGRPVLQRQRLDHPDGPGRRRPLVRQDLQPPDDVRGPRRGQAGRRLRRQLRRLRQADRRPRRVVGDLERPADVDVQPAPGRHLARRRAVHGEGRQVHDRALLQPEEHDEAVLLRARPSTASWAWRSTRPARRPRSPASRSSTTTRSRFTFTRRTRCSRPSISELFILPEHTVGKIPPEQHEGSRVLEDQPDRDRSVQVGQVHARSVDRARRASTTTGAASPSSTGSSGATSRIPPRRSSRSTPARSTSPTSRPTRSQRERENANADRPARQLGRGQRASRQHGEAPGVREQRSPPGAALWRSTASRSWTRSTAARRTSSRACTACRT